MDAHRNDFVNVRYYGGTKEHVNKIRDGMTNMNAALEALQITCGRLPEAKPWRDSDAKLLSEQR